MGFIRENILKILTIFIVFIIIIVICIFALGGTGSRKNTSYSSMENNLIISTKKYLGDNRKLIPQKEGESTKINLDTLINAEYIDELFSLEDENVKCSGYVQITKNTKNYNYIPYIKCGKYYETKKISDKIKENVQTVMGEDGLYLVGNKYVFKGEKPKNYLKIGERIYRIIEINENNEIKLISTDRYQNSSSWDDRYNIEKDNTDGINDFSKSRLKDRLEEIYNSSEYFSETEKSKIIAHDICIGKRYKTDVSLDQTTECSVQYPSINVSLIQLSEYARASLDSNCNSVTSKACSNYNYFEEISSSHRTVTAVADNTYQIYYVRNGVANITRASNSFSIYPVIYIDSLSIYSAGDGTLENPYMIR